MAFRLFSGFMKENNGLIFTFVHMKLLLTILLVICGQMLSFSQTTSQEKQFKDYTKTLYEIRFTDGDSAKRVLQEQQELAKKTENNTYIAQNLVNYYHCYWVLQPNPYDSACAYLKKGISFAKKAKDHLLLCDLYGQLGQEYMISGEFDKALSVADKAIYYGKKANVLPQLNNAYYMKSAAERETGNIREALINALEGVKVWDKMEDHSKSNFNPNLMLAQIYEEKGEYEKAIEPIEKVIARNTKDGVMINVIVAKVALASVLENMKDFSGAIRTFKECVEISEDIGQIEVSISAQIRLTNIYLNKDDMKLDSAKYYLNKLDELLPQFQSPVSIFRFHVGYGDYFIELGSFSKAKSRFMKSYNLYKSMGGYPPSDMMVLTEKLANLCDTMNQPAQALAFYTEFMELKEQSIDTEKIEELKEIEMNFDFEKKELAALAEKKETELVHQKDLAREQRGRYALLFGLGLLAVIAVFVWFALQKRKKQAIILNEKNAQIQENLEEKQLLLKEIHHRVKNNFQIVSSLLEMQTRGIEDEQALELAEEGQNRIKSMAIIHQKLYQNDDLLIEFNDYVEQLVGEIQNTFASKKMNTKIEVQSEMILDIDTVIPLGLVLNELITNAFKHGFDSEKEENNLLIKVEKGLGNYSMVVTDSGSGMSEKINMKTTKSTGLYLVRRLLKQLDGTMNYSYRDGSVFEIQFKDTAMRMV